MAMNNRSVPVDVILPHLVYQNVAAAIAWLSDAFGFVEHDRHGPPDAPEGAQMHLGLAWIMLTSPRPGRTGPVLAGCWTQSLTVFVPDPEAHFRRTQSRAARIVEEPHQTPYGELQYAALDLEDHLWLFSRHVRDVAPAEWGARLAEAS